MASVPAGSGIVVNSNDNIEIFDNDIADNQTANIIISSVFSTGYKADKASGEFDPTGTHLRPRQPPVRRRRLPGRPRPGRRSRWRDTAGRPPAGHAVRWFVNPARAGGPQICLRDVSGVVNADGPGGYKNPSKDATLYACSLPSLPAVDLKRG